jgi:hypothetical protein
MDKTDPVATAAARVVGLEAELESAGDATTGGDALAELRGKLHDWVETVVGVVTSPGVGRVTLIHANGRESRIASPDLPFLLSAPVLFDNQGES